MSRLTSKRGGPSPVEEGGRIDSEVVISPATLLDSVCRFTVIAIFTYVALRALFAPVDLARWLSLFVTFAVVGVATPIVSRRVSPSAACRLFLVFQWVCITLFALTGGGIASPSTGGYVLLVLSGGLLLGWRTAIGVAVTCCATEAVLVFLELRHLLPTSTAHLTPVTRLMAHALFASVVVAFVRQYGNLVSTYLSKANAELSERRRTESALAESEERFENAFYYASIGMTLASPTGRWLKVNRSFCALVGYSEDELLEIKFQEMTHPDDIETDHYQMHQMLENEAPSAKFDKRFFHKDGQTVWVTLSVSTMRDADGAVRFFICQFEDITERKRLEIEREKTRHALGERVKELTTLHRVSQLLQDQESSIPEMLQAIVSALPSGWQYPEVTAAQIVLDDLVCQTENFSASSWPLRSELTASGRRRGFLEVAYLDDRPTQDEGPFLKEERHLIDTLAEMIGTALRRRQAESHSRRQLEHITALHSIGIAVLSNLDRDSILKTALDQVIGHLDVDTAAIWILNSETSHLSFAAGLGWRSQEGRHADDALARTVASDRRAISISNIETSQISAEHKSRLREDGISAYFGVPLIAKGVVRGVLEVYRRSPLAADADWLSFLEGLAGQTAMALDSIELFDGLQQKNHELSVAYNITLEGWSKALDLRDKETEGHTARVTQLTVELAKTLGIEGDELLRIQQGALLHDVGKLGIPDSILLKEGPLTDEEWIIMQKHPSYAFEWLSAIEYLRPALDIPHCHHEKWNGKGYPQGLSGTNIPLAARIFSLVDVFDALVSDRPYRQRWDPEKTLHYILDRAGTDFDPEVTPIFVEMMKMKSASKNPLPFTPVREGPPRDALWRAPGGRAGVGESGN